jgi:ABC-type Zn uptake system ZnuABC Zn-binding protein ZnuA
VIAVARLAPAVIALAATLSGCASSSAVDATAIKVVTTVTQVTALTRAVAAGSPVQLTALAQPGDDPHAFEPRPSDIAALASSKLVIKSGAGLDHWIDGPVASASSAQVLDLSTFVSLRPGDEGQDPHWWYDADNAKKATDAIADRLGAIDPANRQRYLDNATAEKGRLDAADRDVHAAIDPIPVAQRLFVANHDAFNYFLARYDITLVGDIIPSTDTLSAIRPADTARLIQAIRDQHVKAIFTETTLDPGVATQVAQETGARVFDGKLYADAIGGPGTPGETLEGAIAENGRQVAAGLRS